MSAVDQQFARLRSEGKKAFIPFVTAGDPDLNVTIEALKQLSQSGAAIAEVGFPYSDPIADGPVIQASYTRALEAGITISKIFEAIGSVSAELKMPLVAMVSYSIIDRIGADKFIDQAIAAGFSGAIVPDLLVEEAADLRERCLAKDFSLIHLVTPTTPDHRMIEIAKSSTGFIYFVSVTGITGERNELPAGLTDKVKWLREQTDTPVCIGFGISKPEHVQKLGPVADGIIVGSAVVRRLAEGGKDALASVDALAKELIAEL